MIRQEKAQGVIVLPKLPTQSWYPMLISVIVNSPVVLNPSHSLLSLPGYTGKKHPLQKNDSPSVFVVKEKLLATEQGFSPATIEIFLLSWRQGTKMQYNLYFRKWLAYCNERSLNIFSPSVSEALDFPSLLYHKAFLTVLYIQPDLLCSLFY